MADDRHYVGGDYYQLDDLSGFKIRASRSRKIPGGQTGSLIVAPEHWEPQQPQDFVRGVVDDQTVPEPRTRQTNQFMVVASYVVAPSARLATTIEVQSTVGFTVGDNLQIMLDNGTNFFASASAIVGNVITLSAALPGSVGSTAFGDPLENTVIDLSAPTRALNWPVL